MKYVISLDAGTTSIRAFVYDVESGAFVHCARQETTQEFPHDGWVEQDAEEIYYKAAYCLNDCVRAVGAENVAGIGVTNQRETVVAWDRETGDAICPAIVWQCRRTSAYCASLPKEIVSYIREKTGLVADGYFSASKIKWILDCVPEAKRLMQAGRLCTGTVDCYLIYKLTGGKRFVTDATNASRTMLYDIKEGKWDETLLSFFGIPREILPEVLPCDARFGETAGGKRLPVAGVAGDQQAALFGQACFAAGEGKITYGTGLFLLFHTGAQCVRSEMGLLSTIACSLGGKVSYALEGSVFNAGSSVQWLRDEMGLISTAAESETLARSVPDAGGVSFVPAFTGLGAPHWDADARGLLCGITRGTTRAHVVRAVLESIAYGAREVLECMLRESGVRPREVRCDGGASANDFLMQYQADVLHLPVNRPKERESTALGAAYLCALSLGIADIASLSRSREAERIFTPKETERADSGYQAYLSAVKRALLHP